MEIKPQDFRLNNIVLEAGEESRIYLIEHRYKDNYTVNDLKLSLQEFQKRFKGIELTPEWLERFGFDNSFLKLKTFYQGQKTLTLKVTVNMTVAALLVEHIDGKFSEYIPFPIKHVHQLQNLYFALTGEELAIDKTSLKNETQS